MLNFFLLFITIVVVHIINIFAIKNFNIEQPLISSFYTALKLLPLIIISNIGFNYYYGKGNSEYSYSFLLLMVIIFNIFISLLIDYFIFHNNVELRNLTGILFIFSGLLLIIYK